MNFDGGGGGGGSIEKIEKKFYSSFKTKQKFMIMCCLFVYLFVESHSRSIPVYMLQKTSFNEFIVEKFIFSIPLKIKFSTLFFLFCFSIFLIFSKLIQLLPLFDKLD